MLRLFFIFVILKEMVMKKIALFLLVILTSFFFSCQKDDTPTDINNNQNNNNPPAVAKGDLEVYVHLDKPTGMLWGGALVNLYKTKEDRDSNKVYRFNYTSTSVPYSAYFDTLDVQVWYIKASFSYQGKDYEGLSEVQIAKDIKISHHMTATKK